MLIIAVLALPVAVLTIQIIYALGKEKPSQIPAQNQSVSFTVLIPAHNEAEIIDDTLVSIKAQVTGKGKILLIADNCSDGTERLARDLGVEVLPRSDSNEKGKGYALGFGIKHIGELESKPDALVILDADCTISAGEISDLAAMSIELNRPVQALYLMHSNETAGMGQKVAEFAWLVKNRVRALGYRKLGFPCQLMGSGMAFPWSLVSTARFSSGNIVEDLELGINYTLEGHSPSFYPEVSVSSYFPSSSDSEKSQRRRWEHGHLVTSIKMLPRLVRRGIVNRDIDCAALAVDLLVPPLSLLTILLVALNVICLVYAVVHGGAEPWFASLILLAIFCFGILLAWYRFGRGILTTRQLLYIPVYILNKVPLYLAILVKRQVKWVKTSRGIRGEADDE
jgi:cellulose synthase/poly-beta-1,6-N-acetylglucosamine synthase-like glycosyltransferase